MRRSPFRIQILAGLFFLGFALVLPARSQAGTLSNLCDVFLRHRIDPFGVVGSLDRSLKWKAEEKTLQAEFKAASDFKSRFAAIQKSLIRAESFLTPKQLQRLIEISGSVWAGTSGDEKEKLLSLLGSSVGKLNLLDVCKMVFQAQSFPPPEHARLLELIRMKSLKEPIGLEEAGDLLRYALGVDHLGIRNRVERVALKKWGILEPQTASPSVTQAFITRVEESSPESLSMSQRANRLVESGGYTVNRGLTLYASYLYGGFLKRLKNLTADQTWLDLGAGNFEAIYDYFSDMRYPAVARTIGVSKTPPTEARSLEWLKRSEVSRGRFQDFVGKYFEEIPENELGKIDMITDVYGAIAYTPKLDEVLAKCLRLLKVGGTIEVLFSEERNEFEVFGVNIGVLDWLALGEGFTVESTAFTQRGEGGVLRISIKKTEEKTSIWPLTLKKYEGGGPSYRTFGVVRPN